jgi:hypothetical protein
MRGGIAAKTEFEARLNGHPMKNDKRAKVSRRTARGMMCTHDSVL